MGPRARFLFDAISYFQRDLLRSRDDPAVCVAIELLDVVISDSVPDESRLAAWETILGLLGLDEDDPKDTWDCQ